MYGILELPEQPVLEPDTPFRAGIPEGLGPVPVGHGFCQDVEGILRGLPQHFHDLQGVLPVKGNFSDAVSAVGTVGILFIRDSETSVFNAGLDGNVFIGVAGIPVWETG